MKFFKSSIFLFSTLISVSVFAGRPNFQYASSLQNLIKNNPFSISPTNSGSPIGKVRVLAAYGKDGFNGLGFVDGQDTSARFAHPVGMIRDTLGNIYVVDQGSQRIRKISPSGMVSTYAGTGNSGNTNGPRLSATFNSPSRITMDKAGNLYVVDAYKTLIRKITPSGIVSNLCGIGGVTGHTDGTGNQATFNNISDIVVDNSGNLYVGDNTEGCIRKITPNGTVSTLAGSLNGVTGFQDGAGVNARFSPTLSLTWDNRGFLLVSDANYGAIRKVDTLGNVTTLVRRLSAQSVPVQSPVANMHAPNLLRKGPDGYLYYTSTDSNSYLALFKTDSTFSENKILGRLNNFSLQSDSSSFLNIVGNISDILFNPNGDILFTDYLNNCIYKMSPSNQPKFYITTYYEGLPNGVIFNSANGSFQGTPNTLSVSRLITVSAMNMDGITNFNLYFSVDSPVVISSVLPTQGYPGSKVVIKGSNLFNISNVLLGSASVFQFGGDSLNLYSFMPNAVNGTIQILKNNTSINAGSFSYLPPPAGFTYPFSTYLLDINAQSPGIVPNDTLARNFFSYRMKTLNSSSFINNTFITENTRMAQDNIGNIYFTVPSENKIVKRDTAGIITTFAQNIGSTLTFYQPLAITVDANQNLIIANSGDQNLKIIYPSGIINNYGGNGIGCQDGPRQFAKFKDIQGMATDINGNIIIADAGCHAIRKISPAGVVTTVAGSSIPGYTDAIGSSARFNSPKDVTTDPLGNIYVADFGNKRIRKIDQNNLVTTIGGDGTSSVNQHDGWATQTSVGDVYCLTTDSVGRVYFSDFPTTTLSVIDTDGYIKTVGNNYLGSNATSSGYIKFHDQIDDLIMSKNNSLLMMDHDNSNNLYIINEIKDNFCTISPELPNGLFFNKKNGIISGTPTAFYDNTHSITTQNYSGSLTSNIRIKVLPAPHFYSFFPTSGQTGTIVTIKGKKFIEVGT